MESLLQDLIKAFGWSILNSVWQSGIIYAVLFTILLLAPKLKARARHNLAYISVCAMFGWFLITFINQVGLTARSPGPSSFHLSDYGFYLSQLPETLSEKAEGWFPVIVSAYLAGILLQLFVILRGYIYLKKLKTTHLSMVPETWQHSFSNIRTSLGLNRNIKFRLSGLVNVPVVVGYLKPIVLFPVSLVSQLDNDQVEAILIHELSHIRRNDYLLNLIKTCIETLLFFNPFLWLAGKFIQIEREHACDDLVLKLSGKPLTYAHALLKLELIRDNQTPAYALAATGKTQHLYQRIKRITNMKTNYLNTKQQMAALTLAVAGLLSVAWVNPEVKEKAKEVTMQIADSKFFKMVSPLEDTDISLAADTGKKKIKMKIMITDEKGNTKEYTSIDAVPDSLKKNLRLYSSLDKAGFLFNGDSSRYFGLSGDSLFASRFKRLDANIYKRYNSPEMKLQWEKMSRDMEKEFNSPEAKAKWKKLGEDMQKAYNSTEAQAQWKKLSEDMLKEFNSPEAKAKWKKMGEDMEKQFNSPEWKKQQENYFRMGNVYRYGVDSIVKRYKPATVAGQGINKIIVDGKEVSVLSAKARDLIARLPGVNYRYRDSLYNLSAAKYKIAGEQLFNSKVAVSDDLRSVINLQKTLESAELRNSEEYKKLKEKYEKDVAELKKKLAEKNKKD